MDAKIREKIKKHLRMFSNPILLIDREVKCVYCNRRNFCRAGTSLCECFHQSPELRDESVEEALMTYKGKSYCARISPFIEDLFICELFTSDTIMKMAERTDVYAEIAPLLASVDSNAVAARKKMLEFISLFHNNMQVDYLESIVLLERPVVEIEKTVKNFAEYTNMCLRNSKNDVIEVREFILDLQKRLNTDLASSGRYIDVLDTIDMFCVSACKRHILTALLNAVQNAMLFSPNDSVPVITFYKEREAETGRKIVVIQIVNEIISHADEIGEYEFGCVRAGLGIPIIKRFAEDAGGEVTIEYINGKYRLCVKLPEYIPKKEPEYIFGSTEEIQYSDGELELMRIFTREINLSYKQN